MDQRKKSMFVWGAIIIVSLIMFAFAIILLPKLQKKPTHSGVASSTLQAFTTSELSGYDGSSTTLPIYLALDGYVYDVTAGKRFYAPGAVYHYLAGKDSSKSLRIMGGDIIKQKYRIVGYLLNQ